MNDFFKKPVLITALCAAFGGQMVSNAAFATDHGDTALVNGTARNDARLSDYFALNSGKMLAFILNTNPTIGTPAQLPAQSQTNYIFPTDVKFTANVDNHSKVNFNDALRNAALGGTIEDTSKIQENFTFTFTFDSNNKLTTIMSSPDTALGISGFYPTEVNQGDLVYVLGSGFNGAETKVRVNGRLAVLSRVLSDNVLVFIAPIFGGKTGVVTISTDEGASVSSTSELVINKFQGITPETLKNVTTILTNTAVTDAIKAGNVMALADIGLPVHSFSGLRDDPFIRTVQQGKNIAAMAVELPQSLFTHGRQKVLITWGTSAFNSITGPSSDVAGRSFGSMFTPEQFIINTLHPSQQVAALEAKEAAAPAIGAATQAVRATFLMPCQTAFQPFSTTNPAQQLTLLSTPPLNIDCAPGERMLKAPDVMIFDTTKPQHFPDGRAMDNDQIDLIAPYDPRVENLRRMEINATGVDIHGAPVVASPAANDVPLSPTFPYLGLPQP